MSSRPVTPEGTPISGWILRSSDATSVIADLKEFGQVFRFPLPDSDRIDLIEAGQPCFLYVAEPGNPKVKPGIWAVGEIVGPVTVGIAEDHEHSATDGAEVAHRQERLFAEVELIPLRDRITLGALLDHRVLSDLELIDHAERDNPFVVRPRELRALEEWDFALVEPTEAQMERLDEVLAEDDGGLILQIAAVDRSIGVLDDGVDGLLAVVAVDPDDRAVEIGRYQEFADALEAVAHHAADFEFATADPADAGAPPRGEPIGVLDTADGPLRLHRSSDGIELWDVTGEPEALAAFEDLPAALEGLAAIVEEVGSADH